MRFPSGIGQYVPVESPVHDLHALAKMGIAAALTVALFSFDGFAGLVAVALLVSVAVRASRVPARIALRGIRSLAVILSFTLIAHGLTWGSAPSDVLVSVGSLNISVSGLTTGVFFAARIVVLVVGTSLLTLTTSPVDLTEALEKLMRPLERFRFPAHDVAMMLTLALRFIPTTAAEAEKIVTAQIARGARFGEGGLIKRAKAYVPVMLPLFVALFRRVDDLATAMEARCYRGGEGRTRLDEARMTSRDWVVMLAGIALLVALAVVW